MEPRRDRGVILSKAARETRVKGKTNPEGVFLARRMALINGAMQQSDAQRKAVCNNTLVGNTVPADTHKFESNKANYVRERAKDRERNKSARTGNSLKTQRTPETAAGETAAPPPVRQTTAAGAETAVARCGEKADGVVDQSRRRRT